jgi:5'-deoxynucleotidase YfbR-like HD superfamily hydrolase/N-acetylglutamate synthase-like GNAT family acetyltransferase
VTLLALLLAPPELNRARLLSLATVHDLAEAIVGDITPHDSISTGDKRVREYAATKQLAGCAGMPELIALWQEYHQNSTPEARFIHELDALEMASQAISYQRNGCLSSTAAQPFLTSASSRIQSRQLCKLLADLISSRTLPRQGFLVPAPTGPHIRPCTDADFDAICTIINDAADAYRGIIPADRWHEPYMPREELRQQIRDGVIFYGYQTHSGLVGVMGLQHVQDVTLIRHAYVRTAHRKSGIGGKLLRYLRNLTDRPILIGTWAAATWAIAFYEKHGFRQVTPGEKDRLLRKYWSIPDRQVETSVVLCDPPAISPAGLRVQVSPTPVHTPMARRSRAMPDHS